MLPVASTGNKAKSGALIPALGAICGLNCFNLQATVSKGFFLAQFLTETSDFMFRLAGKLKHGV